MLPGAGLEINTRVELKNYPGIGEANSGLGNRRWGGIPALKIRDRSGKWRQKTPDAPVDSTQECHLYAASSASLSLSMSADIWRRIALFHSILSLPASKYEIFNAKQSTRGRFHSQERS